VKKEVGIGPLYKRHMRQPRKGELLSCRSVWRDGSGDRVRNSLYWGGGGKVPSDGIGLRQRGGGGEGQKRKSRIKSSKMKEWV